MVQGSSVPVLREFRCGSLPSRPLLRRSEVRSRALACIEGLLSAAERKHGRQLAAVQGDATPYGMSYLRHRACGSADAACAALQRYVSDPLGDPQGILRIDETGFRKQGTHSAGVARQDRERYLPRAWTDDPDWGRYLRFRRPLQDPEAWQAYGVYAPQTGPTATLVQVAGRRGRIEQAFPVAKGQVGLDAYEVPTAHGRAAAWAWRRSAGGGGTWCSRYPPPRPRSWLGHSGAASIHGWPCTVTGNADRPSSFAPLARTAARNRRQQSRRRLMETPWRTVCSMHKDTLLARPRCSCLSITVVMQSRDLSRCRLPGPGMWARIGVCGRLGDPACQRVAFSLASSKL